MNLGPLVIPAILANVLALALAGCLVPDEDDDGPMSAPACSLFGGPDDVAADAADTAGPGPRTVRIANVPFGNAIAVWWAEGDALAVLHLRSREASGGGGVSIEPSMAMVPANVAVRIVAGEDRWTQDGFVAAGTEEALVDLAQAEIHGSSPGTWTEAASFGPAGASWRPTPLHWADGETMARLATLHLELTWSNGPGGGADFGIAVGPDTNGGFSYTNSAYQTTLGEQRETRDLGVADFAQLGWTNATRPQAGPSISTGAFASTGIPYELSWAATFFPDPDLARVCTTLGDAQAFDVMMG